MDEPIFDKLYAMIDRANNLPPYLYNVVSKEKIDLFLNESIPEITQDEVVNILNYLPVSVKQEIDKITLAVIHEIDFNVAMLTTSDQVKRYLEHAHIYLSIALDKINYNSRNTEIEPKFRKFCDPKYLEKLKRDENYVNHKFEPDEWKPPFLHVEFNSTERRTYYLLCELLYDIDFFEREYSMILSQIEDQQIKNGFRPKYEFRDETNLTHRQHAIIRQYKIDARCLSNEFIRVDIVKQFGKKREQAIDSVNPHSVAYKPIKSKELLSILPFLDDCPDAQKAATNDLANLS